MRPLKIAFAALLLTAGCTGDAGSGLGEDGFPDDGIKPGKNPEPDHAPGCPSALVTVRSVPPTVMVLVDQSGSMDADFGNSDRWNAMYRTLMDANDGLLARMGGNVAFGLTTYSSDDGAAPCPSLSRVDPAFENYDNIRSMYEPLEPAGDTPTGESIAAVAEALANTDSQGQRAIVLATDGEPDTCAAPDPDGQPAAQAMAVNAASSAFSQDIETHVISVGSGISDSHLQELANAGVGVSGQNAPYYRALEPNDLVDAFQEIILGVSGCAFNLDGTVADVTSGIVRLDGDTLEEGTDWRLTGDSSFELIGDACDQVLEGGDHVVDAVFACEPPGESPPVE